MTESEWNASTDPQAMLEHLQGYSAQRLRQLQGVSNGTSDRKLRLFACACVRHVWHLLKDRRLRAAVEEAEEQADGAKVTYARMALGGDVSTEFSREYRRNYGDVTILRRALWNAADAVGILCDSISPGFPDRGEQFLRSIRRAELCESGVDPDGDAMRSELKPECPWAAALLRDVFGNSFRPVTCGWKNKDVARAWFGNWRITLTIVKLSQGIYDERAFDRLPVLADALEEAGCTDADILAHCRGLSRCPKCLGSGAVAVHHRGQEVPFRCGRYYGCGGTGWVPDPNPVHCRGCHVIDCILGKGN